MKKYFKFTVLPYILNLVVRFIYLTNKKVYHHNNVDLKEPVIIAFWHGELLMQPYNYKKIRPKGQVKGMISHHKDGELITKTVEHLGIGAIRGSSSKGGAKALISAIKELKSGNDIAITPDGPRGPRFSVADGVVAIAQKSGAKILVFNFKASKYWQMKSWDKFIIPKPFGTIEFYIQEPLDISSLEIQEAKDLIKEEIMKNAVI